MRNAVFSLAVVIGLVLSGCGAGVSGAGAGIGVGVAAGTTSSGDSKTTFVETNLVVFVSDSPVDDADAVYVTIERGLEIYGELRKRLAGGAALPDYVLDLPDGSGKIPVESLSGRGLDPETDGI